MTCNAFIVGVAVLIVGAMISIIAQRDEISFASTERDVAASPEVHEDEQIDAATADAPVRTEIADHSIKRAAAGSPPPVARRDAVAQSVLFITVLDEATGSRLPNARVTLARCPFGCEFGITSDTIVGVRTTNANGEVRIAADCGVPLIALVEEPFLAEPAFVTLTTGAGQALVIRVQRAARLVGRVETRAGAPIADAFIELVEHRADGSTSPHLRQSYTERDGTFAVLPFRVLAGAMYSAHASADGFADGSIDRVAPLPGESVQLPTLMLEAGGIEIVGTVVADSFDVAGTSLRLLQDGWNPRCLDLQTDGAFVFHVRVAGDYELELEFQCLDGHGVRSFTIPPGTARFDCGIVRASSPSMHFTGRVVAQDGATSIGGTVRCGGSESHLQEDGSFDLRLCSAGPLTLDIEWSTGQPESREVVPNFVFPSTTGNELHVRPRGILVRTIRNGELTYIDRRVLVHLKSAGVDTCWPITSFAALWRVPDLPDLHAGAVTLTMTVEGKPSVSKSIELGADGPLGPEVMVTFDYAELGLE